MNTIGLATESDTDEILALYRSMLGGPADWNEYYPNEETIKFDLSRDALYAMKNEAGEILSVISIDQDEEVEKLTCWSKELIPSSELARLCVRADMQNQGISKTMMQFVFDLLKKQGKRGVHILVRPNHVRALSSYKTLGFQEVGKCRLFEKDFVCMEIAF